MGEDGSRLRFIKKLPRSAGAPSWKLSIQHSVVSRHLQHFVNKSFELASSEHSEQTWQGSIAPRRNKERNEYILQGWKLFGEAHRFQAGDQVSFELVGSRRFVVTCIQPGTEIASLGISPELVDYFPGSGREEPAAKVPKYISCSSPSAESAWRSSLSAEQGDREESQNRSGSSGRVEREEICPPMPSDPPSSRQMAHRVQSWMSLNMSESAPECQFESPAHVETADQIVPSRATAFSSQIKHQTSDVSLDCQAPAGLPGIFDDIAAEIDDGVPEVLLQHPLSIGASSDQMSFMSDSIAPRQEAPIESSFRAFVQNHHGQLDLTTRSALQATMRMETMVMDSYKPVDQHDNCQAQADMFKHLCALKESLWQLLVLANEMRQV